MLNNFSKGSIIDDVWRSLCASERNSIESYIEVAAEAILKNANFHSVKYGGY